MLKSHLKTAAAHAHGEGEAGFARFIASQKLFYKKVRDRYILLDVSSITTYLRNAKSKVLTEIAEERAEKKKRKKDCKRRK